MKAEKTKNNKMKKMKLPIDRFEIGFLERERNILKLKLGWSDKRNGEINWKDMVWKMGEICRVILESDKYEFGEWELSIRKCSVVLKIKD